MKRYRFLGEADAEFQEHISYYDQQASGLGDRFIEDVDRVIRSIRRWPESGVRIAKNVRKRVLHVFRVKLGSHLEKQLNGENVEQVDFPDPTPT